ncbi:MAG: O-antigen ligase family protein [Coprobacillaceae bacterium]
MQYIQTLRQKLTKEEWLVMIPFLSFSMPAYICVPILLIETIYLLYTKKIQTAYKNIKESKYLMIFCTFSLVISLFFQNLFGIGCSLFMFVACALLLYYRDHITKDLFSLALEILIFCSILWAIYACYEYIKILDFLEYDHFVIKVFSRREYRINSVFFNANYYAMMIEFILMMIGYKIFTTDNKKKIPYYLVVALINFVMLFLSGTRTAWPAIAAGAIVFLIINKNYKWCLGIGIAAALVVGYFVINPSKMPRVEKLASNYSTRIKIWSASIAAIKDSPIIGKGPMTYYMIFKEYGGHATEHAHNIFIDPVLSYGFGGVALLVPYIYNNCKQLFQVFKRKCDRGLVAFIVGCVVVTLIHGLLDFTVYFVHTGLLFLFITGAFSIYTRDTIE